MAQALYDGDGKKLITYPRAEARHLAENQIGDVGAIVAAMTRLRGFAHLEIAQPVIRRGKSGHFCDAALEGVSHHAIVPNVNVMDDLEARIARLSDDEKRLFALICRCYLAAVMPDFEYRQTVVTIEVPLPDQAPKAVAEFRAVGRIPLKQGWKAAFGAIEPEPETKREAGREKAGDADAEQTLPPLSHGDVATLTKPRVEAKETQPPPRYNEGTLVDAMQNAWRFVKDAALRERLKEAKGIGTPATRAEIIKGLKRQNMLAANGKLVVPTPAGLQLFELLRGAAPALVDPGTTAVWEMRLDDVVVGKADYRAVIAEIADEAGRLIGVLRAHTGGTVDFGQPAPSGARRGNFKARRKSAVPGGTAMRRGGKGKASGEIGREDRRPRRAKAPPKQRKGTMAPAAMTTPAASRSKPPTERMIAFAVRLAKDKKTRLPPGYDRDFEICQKFLDQQLGR